MSLMGTKKGFKLRTCQEHTRGSEKNNLFFSAFPFLNLEYLNYIMSYTESESVRKLFLVQHIPTVHRQ